MWEGENRRKREKEKDYFKKNYLISVTYSHILYLKSEIVYAYWYINELFKMIILNEMLRDSQESSPAPQFLSVP